MPLLLKSAVPVWVVCVLCAVAIGVWAAPEDYLVFLPVALGFVMILAMGVQLLTRQADGYIMRMSSTIAGCLIILGLATAVLAPIALTTR